MFVPASKFLTPEQRRLRAQIAANTRWSKPGAREAHGDKISASKLRRHERLVDPDGRLDPKMRARLAENSLRAEMQRLAFASSKARKAAS